MANGAGIVNNVVFDHLSGRWVGNKYPIYANDRPVCSTSIILIGNGVCSMNPISLIP